ncbi:MAG: hypothetical protein C5B49_14250 [Bdellovibrio sp.]|nr:MAG: hypothetical protein C5B49_14250 [Bdellovibrio sp.]
MVGSLNSRKPLLSSLLMVAALILFCGQPSHSETLFEGYYRVFRSGQHVGFFIMRHRFEPVEGKKKKFKFTSTTFMKTVGEDGEDTESIKAVCDENLVPLSYSYTALSGKKTRTIDATFADGKYTAHIKNNGQDEKIQKPLPTGVFLSQFLLHYILRTKQGLKPNLRVSYRALAEEFGEVKDGVATTKDYEVQEGLRVLRVENTFLGQNSINFVSEKGEIISTHMTETKMALELTASPSTATADFKVPSPVLAGLFGEVPTGQKNILSQIKHEEVQVPKPIIPEGATKQQGVPAGKGIQLKAKIPRDEPPNPPASDSAKDPQ